MKKINLLLFSLIALWQLPASAEVKINNVSGVYIGGHIRRERPNTIKKRTANTYSRTRSLTTSRILRT